MKLLYIFLILKLFFQEISSFLSTIESWITLGYWVNF
jgi:hypothetical protein